MDRFHLLYLLLIITIIASCVQKRKDTVIYDNEEHFISELLKQGKLVRIDSLYNDIKYDNLLDSCINYLSKSHCSVCIMNSIQFLKEYNLMKEKKAAIIISENDSAMVDYYYGNVPEITNRFRLCRNINSFYVENDLDYYNGLVILKNGRHYDTYKFVAKE